MHRLSILAAALALCATPAAAHVVLANPVSTPGAYYVAAFRVGHSCGVGQTTTALTIQLPPGVTSAKAQPKAGWAFEQAEGQVTWKGRLLESEFDEFAILVRLPTDAAGPIYFPAVQTCDGGERRWVEIPDPGQPWTSKPSPAPVVTVDAPAQPAAQHQH
jgi:uncharacterized protein YcnI